MNYLELVGILSNDPAQHQAKIEDLRTLFLNAHHLINEYRPHQAREAVIEMVEKQLESRRAEVEGVKRMREKVDTVLAGLGDEKVAVTVEEAGKDVEVKLEEEKRRRKRNREERVWRALEAIEI